MSYKQHGADIPPGTPLMTDAERLQFDQVAILQPDLIIVDLVVGIRAGWDLLERLQQDAVSTSTT